MLEITANDVSQLDDSAFRELIVRLCEAELAVVGLPSSHLTAGGSQDAPDGGIDIRIEAPETIGSSGYIPRGRTGIQVKASKMPPQALIKEMAPRGVLRASIGDLVTAGGAYVVACSKASPADTRLAAAKTAMSTAVGGVTVHPDAVLEFLGADRIALWCRRHPGVVAWARHAVGRPIQGWSSFANWSRPDEGVNAAFLLDKDARVVDERTPQGGPLSVEEGIARLRGLASKSGEAIRLIGLSGVGKTRLAQALFDGRVGEAALPPSKVLYCDFGLPANPSPTDMARQLVANKLEAILLVDNCSPETHRGLASIIKAPESRVSLLSIEYDVRDDDMEGTEVFRLEPASEDVTTSLIERRYPHVNGADRRRIAEIAGGNARIAMALAHTVRKGESLGRLRDDGLFERLFLQRNSSDTGLLAAAEIAALVYSFDGENEEADGELAVLAALAEQSVTTFKSACAELKRRDLLQARSHWRAVLPHAVANRLAARALDRLDIKRVTEAIEIGGERLLKSFTRRLAFLHDVPPAQRLAESWFGLGGRLDVVDAIGEADFALFRNLAPLAPEGALDAIGRAAERDGTWARFRPRYRSLSLHELGWLVRALAFDPALFDRAACRLTEMAIADDAREHSSNERWLGNLFKLYLSGTMSPPGQRRVFAERLARSEDKPSRDMGMSALDDMLECQWFSSTDVFDFGARPRGFGWEPSTQEDVVEWFEPTVKLLQDLALSDLEISEPAKAILARRFRSLWWRAPVQAALTDAMTSIAHKSFWPEGWIGVRTAFRDGDDGPMTASLKTLEADLRPTNLLEQARAYGFSKGYGSLDLADGDDDNDETPDRWSRVERKTERIAEAVALDAQVLEELLPDLVVTGMARPWSFGRGLATGAVEPTLTWSALVSAQKAAPSDQAEPAVLRAFLSGWHTRDKESVEQVLDGLLDDPQLGRWFPYFQTATPSLDTSAVKRLTESLDIGYTDARSYYVLIYGGVTSSIEPGEFATLMRGIAAKDEGPEVALQILHMRLHNDRKQLPIDPVIRQLGRHLLSIYPLCSAKRREDANLAELVEHCLVGAEGEHAAEHTLRRLKIAIHRHHAHGHEYDDLVGALFKNQPRVSLDFFLDRQFKPRQGRYSRSLIYSFDSRGRPIAQTPVEDLLAWATEQPGERHRRLAAVIPSFFGKAPDAEDDGDALTPLAFALLEATPDRASILAEFDDQIRPRSWSGSLSNVLERRVTALRKLESYPDPVVQDWSRGWRNRLEAEIPKEQAREAIREQSFE